MTEKKAKPTIEEIASEYFSGNVLRDFLHFYEFLKSNKLTVVKPTKLYRRSWAVKYKNKKIGAFKIWDKGYWFFSVTTYKKLTDAKTYENYITPEQKKFLLDNYRTEPFCCKGYDNIEFLGQTFNTVCTCWPHFQLNPTGEALEYAKQLTLVNKSIVNDTVMA